MPHIPMLHGCRMQLTRNWVFSALSSNIRNRVESQGQHTTNQYPVDESTEMVSITVANEGSNNNHCAALTPPVKKKSDRYLVMPKSIENIVTVLEGEDKGIHVYSVYTALFH